MKVVLSYWLVRVHIGLNGINMSYIEHVWKQGKGISL